MPTKLSLLRKKVLRLGVLLWDRAAAKITAGWNQK